MVERARQLNQAEFRENGRYVLYWAQMNRRVDNNHALAHAVELANIRKLPLLFYEGLTCSYPYANDRLHTFILEGVAENEKRARKLGAGYAFYLRRRRADPDHTLYDLARDAAAVVTDDYPTFIARGHNDRVPGKLDIPFIVVDGSCIVPMGTFDRRQYAAYTIRPRIKKVLAEYLTPIAALRLHRKWEGDAPSFHVPVRDGEIPSLVASCEIDHGVRPSTDLRGGRVAAERKLRSFLDSKLRIYAKGRNEPSEHATSELSPYLHFGHIGALEIALATRTHAEEHQLIADEFLEELIVRRELAFNFTRFTPNYDSLECLPDWTRRTLSKHDGDERPVSYNRRRMEEAKTYDDLWNATQKELLARGKIHGYYRMYWGKKIMEWASSHAEALALMIEWHDRYALDGRDPNTYTNILWCFGLHDRAWKERPIFGKVRYLSYEGMRRKTDVDAYIAQVNAL